MNIDVHMLQFKQTVKNSFYLNLHYQKELQLNLVVQLNKKILRKNVIHFLHHQKQERQILLIKLQKHIEYK